MTADRDGRTPRAMIHKQILDQAEADPDASMEIVAESVAGATVELVEKVLDEYGDPATESAPAPESASGQNDASLAPDETEGVDVDAYQPDPRVDEFSEKQRETLSTIREHPEATQREIGEALGVSAATICQRLRDIPGFDWENRQGFVSRLFEAPLIGDGQGTVEPEYAGDLAAAIESMAQRLDEIESGKSRPILRPELVHKIIHVCMRSEQFSEEDELELIRALVGGVQPDDA